VSQYATEVDPHQIAEFRRHLKALEQQWEEARDLDEMRAVQASFRGELREYRDQTREQLTRLRLELQGAAAAMASFANGVATNAADHEEQMKCELQRLEFLSAGDIDEMREGIGAAVRSISASLEHVHRRDQLIVAQLHDEIRVLHQEMEMERRALFTDPSSTAWTRQKVDLKIQERLRQNDPFCVIVVCVRNLRRLREDHSRTVFEGTLKALLMRFRGALGDEILIGRWSDEEFVAMIDLGGSAAVALAAELANKLKGPYSIQENGFAHTVVLKLATGSVERVTGSDPAGFLPTLEQLTATLLT
jgi:GGDEF domain-containing protein